MSLLRLVQIVAAASPCLALAFTNKVMNPVPGANFTITWSGARDSVILSASNVPSGSEGIGISLYCGSLCHFARIIS